MADDPIFPPELFEAIIDQLADDLESLCSCALVSRSFYSLANVSSRLQVDQGYNIARLCELLEASPPFAARVRSIHLRDILDGPDGESWITDADLGRCLSLLVSLTRLSIGVSGLKPSWSASLHWPSVSASNHDSIQVTLPTLTSLELSSIDEVPLTLLSQCLSLRSLTLDTVTFSDDSGSAIATDRRSLIQLQSLTLRDLHSESLHRFVSWATCPDSSGGISYLRSLDCSMDSSRHRPPVQRLLNALASSVQCLCLRCFFNSCWSIHSCSCKAN
ncbi:hypothetical protein C8R45DRAFT_990022 [Mycena sanguinolenta]|nr:hypothetical protein C8R45DRAFT_990022 [Mycena sanguinolenta]